MVRYSEEYNVLSSATEVSMEEEPALLPAKERDTKNPREIHHRKLATTMDSVFG